MIRIALVVAYLVSTVLAVIAIDANGGGTLGTVWLGMAILLGAGTGKFRFALLPFVAIPIAVPFGLPADPGDPALPVWFGAAYGALFAAILVALAVLGRNFVESRRRSPKSV